MTKIDQNRPKSIKNDRKIRPLSHLRFRYLEGGLTGRPRVGRWTESTVEGLVSKLSTCFCHNHPVHGPPCQPFVRRRFCSWKQRHPQRSHTPPRTFGSPRNQFLPHTEAHTTVLQGAVNFFFFCWMGSVWLAASPGVLYGSPRETHM